MGFESSNSCAGRRCHVRNARRCASLCCEEAQTRVHCFCAGTHRLLYGVAVITHVSTRSSGGGVRGVTGSFTDQSPQTHPLGVRCHSRWTNRAALIVPRMSSPCSISTSLVICPASCNRKLNAIRDTPEHWVLFVCRCNELHVGKRHEMTGSAGIAV